MSYLSLNQSMASPPVVAAAPLEESAMAAKRKKPLLVAMKGHPATGKSTLAEAIARSLQWPLIDKDDARDCLSMLLHLRRQEHEHDQAAMAKQLNALSYDIMFRIADTQLGLGLGVVVVCPLAWPWLFHQCRSIARRRGVEMIVVECVCRDENLWKERLEQRAISALDQDQDDPGPDQDPENTLPPATMIHAKRQEWASGIQSVFDASASVWWHKPRTWDEHSKNVARYEGQSDYETIGARKIVVDTADPCLDRVIHFLDEI